MINDARQLQGDQGARDPDRLPARLGLEDRPDLGVVLHGPDAGVAERELEIAVAGLRAGAVPRAAAGVVGPRDQPALGEELADRGEPGDAVDLGRDGKGGHRAEARDPEEALPVGVRDELRVQGAFQRGDLLGEPVDLGGMAARLKLGELPELGDAGEVETSRAAGRCCSGH